MQCNLAGDRRTRVPKTYNLFIFSFFSNFCNHSLHHRSILELKLLTMASCRALNCTFLDQFETYLIEYNDDYDSFWPNGSMSASPTPPSPPNIVADPDIAGLGVFALIPLHLCKPLNILPGHSRVLIVCLCHLERGCYWLRLRIRR